MRISETVHGPGMLGRITNAFPPGTVDTFLPLLSDMVRAYHVFDASVGVECPQGGSFHVASTPGSWV